MINCISISNSLDETTNEVIRKTAHAINWTRINTNHDFAKSIEQAIPSFEMQKWLWYRRPFEEEIFSNNENTLSSTISRNENEAWLWNIALKFERKKWINFPLDNWISDKKTHQLEIAKKHGLRIPDYIITGSKESAKKFLEKHNSQCIIKPLSIGYYPEKNRINLIYTNMVSESEDFSGIEIAPVYLQNAIDKDYDVRTIFCNGATLYVKISSPNLDCRRNEMKDCCYEIIKAPLVVHNAYKQCMSENGLRFCTSDFVVDKSGNWVFLEHNPNGNWIWMDEYINGACLNTFVEGLNA